MVIYYHRYKYSNYYKTHLLAIPMVLKYTRYAIIQLKLETLITWTQYACTVKTRRHYMIICIKIDSNGFSTLENVLYCFYYCCKPIRKLS